MRETTILKPHTWLNLTCLGCFMLPATAYESNLGSQVARKFVSHRPTWLSCPLMEEGNIKNLQFIFYIFLYENRSPIICALLEKYCSIFSFLRKAVVEELENSAHSHRRFQPETRGIWWTWFHKCSSDNSGIPIRTEREELVIYFHLSRNFSLEWTAYTIWFSTEFAVFFFRPNRQRANCHLLTGVFSRLVLALVSLCYLTCTSIPILAW